MAILSILCICENPEYDCDTSHYESRSLMLSVKEPLESVFSTLQGRCPFRPDIIIPGESPGHKEGS